MKRGERNPKAAFGLFDYAMLPKINRILKTHGLRLKQRTSVNWGDQVEITVERVPSGLLRLEKRRKRTRPEQPMNTGIGTYGIQMGN